MTEDAGSRISVYQTGGALPPRPDGVVAVLLPGRGRDEHDLQGLSRLVPASWTLVTPQAVHAGAPWGYGPGWAWYRYVAEDRVVPETFEASLDALDTFLDELPRLLGGAPGRVVLGGVSQGGGLSLAYALTRPARVAAALNFSGFLVDGLPLPDPADAPALFWGHGLADPAIPHALAVRGRARLARAGIPVTEFDHPGGHTIVPAEIDAAVEVVEGVDRG